MHTDAINDWLKSTRIISQFCTQDGCIDNESLRYEVLSSLSSHLHINIYFTEIVMEDADYVADRVDCFGQLALQLDRTGRVIYAEVV